MIYGELWRIQEDAALQQIDAAAIRLLEKSGCRIEHSGLLALLEGAGGRVDWATQRGFFPEKLVRKTLSKLGRPADLEVKIPTGWNPQPHLSHAGSFPHLLEWPSGERRLATKEDVVNMAKMAHVLEEFTLVGKVLTCHEVDQRIEPLWAALTIAQLTDKPIGGGEIFYSDYIAPLVRMSEVITGRPSDTSLVLPCDFFIAPLVLEAKQAACFLEKRRFKIENMPGTMPISGLSAPVTIAGTVTVGVAELMAGWVLGYLVDPTLPARGIVASGSLDMQTATACFGSPEALLQDITTAQLCRRLYGLEVIPACNYVDCKRPGLEAAFQKLLPLAAAPFGYGIAAAYDGLLSAGQDYSPVQHLLEAELQGAVIRFYGGFEVNEETIALPLIEQVLTGKSKDFLGSDHTLEHYRREQWYPKWFDRRPWQGKEYELMAEAKMLESIAIYIEQAIKSYQPPEVEQAKIKELRQIFLSYEREVLGSNVTDV